ncbi:MAG TPA: hypothetical protein VI547_14465 [Anaerolineales bacterium]|nr:hypothetical protein [Anaerolineales bacterium]
MTQPNPLQELACTNCGSPIRTTAAPGGTVTCDCCGSTFLIPERQVSAGFVISEGAVIQGDVVGGDNIVAKEGHVIIAGPGARIVVPVEKKESATPATDEKPGEGQ